MQVLVHAELEGSVSEWQGFGRELSRTGVAGDCKSERSHQQVYSFDAQKSNIRLMQWVTEQWIGTPKYQP